MCRIHFFCPNLNFGRQNWYYIAYLECAVQSMHRAPSPNFLYVLCVYAFFRNDKPFLNALQYKSFKKWKKKRGKIIKKTKWQRWYRFDSFHLSILNYAYACKWYKGAKISTEKKKNERKRERDSKREEKNTNNKNLLTFFFLSVWFLVSLFFFFSRLNTLNDR